MLYITIVNNHDNKDEIWDIDAYFDTTYEPEWIDNDYSKFIIEKVDKSEVVAPRIIDSPYLGYVDPTHLSGGTKLILCLAFAETNGKKFNITRAGDNCMRWIQAISQVKDLYVYMSNLPEFYDDAYFDMLITNINKHCVCYSDVLDAWGEVTYRW